MKIGSYVQAAVNNLWGSRIRTLLAMLGIMIGTASVVALVSSGKLAANKAMEQFKSLGTNQMSLRFSSGRGEMGRSQTPQPIKLDTIMKMKLAVPDIVLIGPYAMDYTEASYKTEQFDANLIGSIQQLYSIIHLKIKQGRFISNLDKSQNYCVVGPKVLEKFKDINPIGQRIKLGQMIFIIIGVLDNSPENSFFWGNISEGIFVPLDMMKLIQPTNRGISQVILVLREGANLEIVKKQINDYFEKNMPDYSVTISSAKELIKSMDEQQGTLTMLLTFIGGISLFVGGIGVMNIMLASVAERKYEIGLRLAIGAEPRDIQFMFLMEAVMLAVMGGGIGVLFGVACTYLVAVVSGWTFEFLILPPLVGFSFSVLTSVFFGFYPAYTASKLNPIEALRSS